MSFRTYPASAARTTCFLATLLPLALLAAVLTAAGCSKDSGASAASTGGDSAAQIAAGKTVFASNNCMRCHSVNGQGGRRAPDLSHAGADPQHTATWLAAYVKNPKSQDPSSRMPAFGDRISDTDLASLGAYLASLK